MKWRYGGISKAYICPHCRNLFLVPFQTKGGGKTHWVYKRHKVYYCSYHCYRESEERIYDGTYT